MTRIKPITKNTLSNPIYIERYIRWRCEYMTRIKPITKNTLSNPIYIERYIRPKSKLLLGIFVGFWLGYSPYVIHQIKWLEIIH